MAKQFDDSQWAKIGSLFASSAERFGLPINDPESVLIGTFNIRKLSTVGGRSTQAWNLLVETVRRFDLLAIQEVGDNLEALLELSRRLGSDFELVVSDSTGTYPGARGNAERLAFVFQPSKVRHTELSSDITHDRSKVVETLFQGRVAFAQTFEDHAKALDAWQAAGRPRGKKPVIELPRFTTFIRQPHCASFEVPGRGGADPYELIAVNAHLLYGKNPEERRMEFDALIEWLSIRSKKRDRTFADNYLLLGDCNLEFKKTQTIRQEIDDHLKSLNKSVLKSKKAATANFPLLTPHPTRGELRTNLRQTETYDQIGLFAHDERLPTPEQNQQAGSLGPSGYDYGVFDMVGLFSQALFERPIEELRAAESKLIVSRSQHDVSDHMPAWIRLPIPAPDAG
jgi:endonuclease/exonuclease/phosphatase family metal-dependent hydrolase